MQAIITKYLGATDFRGARVKATCQVGSITLSWDYALNFEQNHDAAARALANKLGWLFPRSGSHAWDLVSGGMPDGNGNCYVLVPR